VFGVNSKPPHPPEKKKILFAKFPLLGLGGFFSIDVGDTNVQFSVLYFAQNKDAM
jgi:hypothetical protein